MNQDPTYSEQLTKRILARAVELDHIRSAQYSLTELRNIAAEVGVSESALEQAMRELQQPAPAPLPPLRTRLLLPTVAASAVGVVGGVVDSATYFVSSPLAMGVILMIGGVLAVSEDYQKPARGLLRFQLRNAVAWVCFGALWLGTTTVLGGAGPVATVVLMRVTILGWGLSSLLGSVAAAVHVQLRRTAANTGAGDNEDTRVPLKRRIAAKLKHWIDIWARRSDVQPITEDRAPHATPAH